MVIKMCHLRYSYVLVTVVLALLSLADCLINPVPAIFVFGDSLVDAGNNNYIKSLSKANYEPNGIDFGEPTGRFTNGRTMVDILGQQIGVAGFIPPYLAPSTRGAVVLKGVNYASGSAGILNDTGKLFIKNINMDAQIDNFANTRQTIIKLIGKSAAQNLLRSNALFNIVIGSNDYINNYLIPILSRRKQKHIPPNMFASSLITRFRKQLKRLYSLDARKIIVSNVAPIGCIPYMKDTHPTKSGAHCFKHANDVAQIFNSQLQNLLSDLRRELQGSALVHVNTYQIFSDIIQNYKSYGFEHSDDKPCCRLLGIHGGLVPCTGLSHVCHDRTKYVFWDSYHPSDATNAIIVKRIFDGKAPDVSPMSIRQLLNVHTS